MDDGYAALARAIREPMRRWWLNVGLWWLGLLMMLLAAPVLLRWLDYRNTALRYASCALEDLFWLAFVGLALLAARQVLFISRQLLSDFPTPWSDTLGRAQLRLALAHILPLIVIPILGLLARTFLFAVDPAISSRPAGDVLWFGAESSTYIAGLLLLPIWLVALMIRMPARPWLPWTIAGCAYLLPVLIAALDTAYSVANGVIAYQHSFPFSLFPVSLPTSGWLGGCALVLVLLYTANSRYRLLGSASTTLLLVSGFLYYSSTTVNALRAALHGQAALFAVVTQLRGWFAFLAAPLARANNYAADYWPPVRSGELQFQVPVAWTVTVPQSLADLSLLVLNALYIAGVIAFIYYVVLAPPRGRWSA